MLAVCSSRVHSAHTHLDHLPQQSKRIQSTGLVVKEFNRKEHVCRA